jgi:hypothetical protein
VKATLVAMSSSAYAPVWDGASRWSHHHACFLTLLPALQCAFMQLDCITPQF